MIKNLKNKQFQNIKPNIIAKEMKICLSYVESVNES